MIINKADQFIPKPIGPLMMVAKVGNYNLAMWLLQNDAKDNASSNRGRTAAQEAEKMGHKDVLQLLLLNGADLNIKTNGGHRYSCLRVAKDNHDHQSLTDAWAEQPQLPQGIVLRVHLCLIATKAMSQQVAKLLITFVGNAEVLCSTYDILLPDFKEKSYSSIDQYQYQLLYETLK